MTSPLTLAALHGGAIPGPLTIGLVVAGVIYVMWGRLHGEPVEAKRLLVLPVVFVILGISDLVGKGGHYTGADIGFLVGGAALSVVFGAARGATIELFIKQDYLWQRYRGLTVALWGALIASKLVLILVASLVGASGSTDLMLSLGLSLGGEAAGVGPRALSTGVPFAPDSKRSATQPRGARTDRFTGPDLPAWTSWAPGWANQKSASASSRENNEEQSDTQSWRPPTWRDGLD